MAASANSNLIVACISVGMSLFALLFAIGMYSYRSKRADAAQAARRVRREREFKERVAAELGK